MKDDWSSKPRNSYKSEILQKNEWASRLHTKQAFLGAVCISIVAAAAALAVACDFVLGGFALPFSFRLCTVTLAVLKIVLLACRGALEGRRYVLIRGWLTGGWGMD